MIPKYHLAFPTNSRSFVRSHLSGINFRPRDPRDPAKTPTSCRALHCCCSHMLCQLAGPPWDLACCFLRDFMWDICSTWKPATDCGGFKHVFFMFFLNLMEWWSKVTRMCWGIMKSLAFIDRCRSFFFAKLAKLPDLLYSWLIRCLPQNSKPFKC